MFSRGLRFRVVGCNGTGYKAWGLPCLAKEYFRKRYWEPLLYPLGRSR